MCTDNFILHSFIIIVSCLLTVKKSHGMCNDTRWMRLQCRWYYQDTSRPGSRCHQTEDVSTRWNHPCEKGGVEVAYTFLPKQMQTLKSGARCSLFLRAPRHHGGTKVFPKIIQYIILYSQMRDLCAALGFQLIIESGWDGGILSSATAHLAQSTPNQYLYSTFNFLTWNHKAVTEPGFIVAGGYASASDKPGLGVTLNPEELGNAVFEI